jgi:hypothetical protein
MKTTSQYLADDVYEALKTKLTKLITAPFAKFGIDPETEVIMALGEIGDIWPASVLEHAEDAA